VYAFDSCIAVGVRSALAEASVAGLSRVAFRSLLIDPFCEPAESD
jgi:hypothetical protein